MTNHREMNMSDEDWMESEKRKALKAAVEDPYVARPGIVSIDEVTFKRVLSAIFTAKMALMNYNVDTKSVEASQRYIDGVIEILDSVCPQGQILADLLGMDVTTPNVENREAI